MNYFDAVKQYEEYINNHISNVVEMYNKLFIPLLQLEELNSFISLEELKYNIVRLSKTIYKHDLSKWSKEEFDPYRYHFYPTDEEKKDKLYNLKDEQQFEKAWEHHYKNNPHHPKYWNGKDIPLVFILEMLCDWFAMSKHFGTDCYEWWVNEADKERQAMTDKTIQIVEEIFKILGEK